MRDGWEYKEMDKFCCNPPCQFAKSCRGTFMMVQNCKKAEKQGGRFKDMPIELLKLHIESGKIKDILVTNDEL